MPRFHFEVRGAERFPDPEGVVLKDQAAARREAGRLSTALKRDYPDVFTEGRSFRMWILDELGDPVETLDITVCATSASSAAPDVGPSPGRLPVRGQ